MTAIDYVVRDGEGRLVRGTVGSTDIRNIIDVDTRSEVSLNLDRGNIRDYKRIGSSLEIILEDGRVLVLEGFFSEISVTDSRLYLSANNELVEITFSESWGRTNYAHFDGAASTSAEGELLFEASSGVVANTETTMAAAPLFFGGWGTAGAVGAGVVGTAALGGGGGGGGGTPIDPSVDDGDATVNAATPDISMAGRAELGSTVYVTLGDVTLETQPDENGDWSVTFAGEDMPADGDYTASVRVVTDGEEVILEGPSFVVDTDAPDLGMASGTQSMNDVIDAEWQAGGVELSGTGEPGDQIAVTVDGTTQRAIVDDGGNWYVNIPESVVPMGTYQMPITVTAMDDAGNITTLNDVLDVDTDANALALDDVAVAVDSVINDVENDAGVTVQGTATPGAVIALTLAGVTVGATAAADGTWSATFGPGVLPPGEYDATLVATTTDGAGNVATDSAPVRVDTLGAVSVVTATVETDGTINAAEAADGIVLNGTTQPGSSVQVQFGTASYSATVAADGSWTVTVPASGIAGGEYDVAVTATATDAAGNVTTATGSVHVDTSVNVALDDVQAGDNLITAQEANAGVTLTGTTQRGASVTVTLNGVERAATVSSDGTWNATFASGDLPSGVMELPMTAVATDAAGNTVSDTGILSLDTMGFISISGAPVEGDGIINEIEASDGVIFTGTTQPGSSVTVTFAGTTNTAVVGADGTWTANFAATDIPAGTYAGTLTASAVSPTGNQSTDTATINVDTQTNNFALTSGIVGGDGTLGADELGTGVTLTGTTEPGSSVVVVVAGVSQSAQVAADGSWSTTFASGTIPQGEYSTSMTATMTDPAGNQETLTQSVLVDTVASTLTLSAAPIEGDDVVNAAEASDGVTLTGTADPGAVVYVSLGSVSKTVIASIDGSWSTYYSASEVPSGTYNAGISAYTIDGAGNQANVSDTVRIDTQVTNFAFSGGPVEGDNVITGAEASDGVVVTGMVEAGSAVVVALGSASVNAVVSETGMWTAVFDASDIGQGEMIASLVATATDAAGNTAVINDTVQIDTGVTNLAIVSLPVSDGEVLNAAASDAGLTIGGTVEVGSSVLVTFEGTSQYATVGPTGAWTATFADGDIPVGEYEADVTVLATDGVGNTDTTTAAFQVDNEAPGAPLITAFSTGITGLRGVSTLMSDDSVEIAEITDLGAVQDLNYTTTEDQAFGEVNYRFTSPVSDGSDLVVTAQDAAGNSTSTLFVLENEDDPSVNLENAGLSGFDVEAVDLQFASDADVVITADLVKELSENSDELTIHGGADDQVTMQGAQITGEVRQIGTQTYDVYTLGDDGVSVIIDQDIDVVI